MCQTEVMEKIITHVMIFFLFKSYCFSTAGQATDDSIIRRMRIACWVPKTTNILSEYVILFFFTVTMVSRMCLSVMVYYVGCLFFYMATSGCTKYHLPVR
jgi:hypothetical protein